jgi:thiol-disulfide isomerase/thioredoxin
MTSENNTNDETFIFTSRGHFLECLKLNKGLIIIKFGAKWCGPCKEIKDFVNEQFKRFPNNAICVNVDIDESNDAYLFLKKQRVFSGTIPTLMCWYKNNVQAYPDELISGSNINGIQCFFDDCLNNLID